MSNTVAHRTPPSTVASAAPAVSPAAAPVAPAPPRGRDRGVDLVRAVCVTAVVVLHALMVGVGVEAGAPVFANAAEGAAWFAPLTWLLQVMPLFFVIGGFAGATAYRRSRERGGTARAFVAGRVHRLLLPAVVVITAAGVLLSVLTLAGVPADLVAVAGYRFGQPLWFLAVFLLLQALLPVALRLHERAPVLTLGGLVAGAVLIDALRAASGVDAVGFANLVLVWAALQQFGFVLADGRIDALARSTRLVLAGGAVAALAAGMLGGVWSADLIAHLNPPTSALLLVGLAHTMALSLLRPRLERWAAHPAVAAASGFVNARAMTIYLWHMPVLLTMAGVTALWALSAGTTLPAPSGLEWWLGRPLWLLTAVVATALVALVWGRLEAVTAPRPTASLRRLWVGVPAGLAGVVLLLAVGTGPVTAAVAGVLLLLALRAADGSRTR